MSLVHHVELCSKQKKQHMIFFVFAQKKKKVLIFKKEKSLLFILLSFFQFATLTEYLTKISVFLTQQEKKTVDLDLIKRNSVFHHGVAALAASPIFPSLFQSLLPRDQSLPHAHKSQSPTITA